MERDLFQGQIIRLVGEEADVLGKAFSKWDRDTEYHRLLDTEHARMMSAKKIQEWIEKDAEKEPTNEYFFQIRALSDDRLIGFIGLFGVLWSHGTAWVGIGIGERNDWSNGYGTDAMRLVLRYAFTELNLYRVSLGVFSYNPRAVRSYEKAGFRLEGLEREAIFRDGERSDILIMGILRSEWEQADDQR